MRKILTMMITAVMLLSGCSSWNSMDRVPAKGGGSVLYTVRDYQGTEISFSQKPVKILPISQCMTDIVVDMVEPERIIAVSHEAVNESSFVKFKARKVKNILDRWPSTETIIQLRPDLVLMPENSDVTKIMTLRDAGIKVVVAGSPRNVEEARSRVAFVAEVLREPEAGKRMLDKMDAKLAAVQEVKKKTGSRKKILLAFSTEGAFGRSGGIFDNLCKTAGVLNGAADAGLKKFDHLSKEQIINIDPDILLLPCNAGNDKFAQEILRDPAYMGLKAIKNNSYIMLDEKVYKYNVSQYAADAAYLLAKAAYRDEITKVELFDY